MAYLRNPGDERGDWTMLLNGTGMRPGSGIMVEFEAMSQDNTYMQAGDVYYGVTADLANMGTALKNEVAFVAVGAERQGGYGMPTPLNGRKVFLLEHVTKWRQTSKIRDAMRYFARPVDPGAAGTAGQRVNT